MKRIQDRENGPEQPTSWVYGQHKLWSKAFLCFIMLNFCIFMGFNILLPTMSLYLEKHGLGGGEIGLIYSTFMVSAIAMRTATGFLVSGRSPLPFIGLGLALCALASFGYYWSTTLYKGIFFRLLHGAGFGITSTLITAMASQTIPQSRLGEGMSYLGLGTTVAMAAGPFLGIWLMHEWGFMILFLGAALCCVLAIGVLRLLSFFDPAYPVFSPTLPHPGLTLFSGMAWVPVLLMFILGPSLSAVIIFMALFCQERSLPYAGHFFVIASISIVISRLFSGKFYDRWGHRTVIPPSVLLLFVIAFMLFWADGSVMIFSAAILYGFGVGALFPGMTALTLSYAPMERRTEATASFFNAYDLGFGLGAVILGHIADWAGSYAVVFLCSACMSLVFFMTYAFFYLRRPDAFLKR